MIHVPVWEPEEGGLDDLLAPQTRGLLDRERIRRLRWAAWIVNAGRGSLMVMAGLIEDLYEGHLSAAWFDVSDPSR